MDTAEYDTNTLLITNIASVVFRIYEPCSSDSVMAFASAALDIEYALRQDGHLVLYDALRCFIWHFQVVAKEGCTPINTRTLDSSLDLCGHALALKEQGSLDPASLQKGRPQLQQASHTATSSLSCTSNPDQSQRNAFTPPSQASLHDSDSKPTDNKTEASSIKVVYASFISAIHSSLSWAFCIKTGAVPLNHQTMLLPPEPLEAGYDGEAGEYDPDQPPLLATFKTHLTTTGSLVVGLCLSPCSGLEPLVHQVTATMTLPDTPILAAPFGLWTRQPFHALAEAGTTSLVPSPNTQALSQHGGPNFGDSLWKQACLRVLNLRGVSSSGLAGCYWASLVVSNVKLPSGDEETRRPLALTASAVTMPWPGPLCFRKKTIDVLPTGRVGDTLLSGVQVSHDALGNARGWYNSGPVRDEQLMKRRAERAAAAKELGSADGRASKQSTSASSPGTGRNAGASVASVIYPTPPDGLQLLSGVTPSLDGTLSSPGNTLPAAPPVDIEQVTSAATAVSDMFEVGATSEAKRGRSDANLLGEADTMFGDMDGDMFGDNDITEADFNFFDAQPGAMDLDLPMEDVALGSQTGETSQEVGTELDKAQASGGRAKAVQGHAARDTIVFAKPELKHARSSRNEAAGQRGGDSGSVGTKREPSPFDPHTVFKRVRASLSNVTASNRAAKAFDSVTFDTSLPLIDKKYSQGGQYDYTKSASWATPKVEPGTLPETDYLKRHGRQARKRKESGLDAGSLVRTLTGLEAPICQSTLASLNSMQIDNDGSSDESDEDDSSYTTNEPASPVKSSVKSGTGRLMAHDDDGHDNGDVDGASSNSPNPSPNTVAQADEPDEQLIGELGRLAKEGEAEVPLSLLFSDAEPLNLEISIGDQVFIQVAQIVTQQAAIGSLEICDLADEAMALPDTNLHSQALSVHVRNAQHVLRQVTPWFLAGAEGVNFKGLLDVTDMALVGQQSRLQSRSIPGRDPNAEPVRPSNLYQIPGSHLEVRRSDAKLSALPSAISFWESLGLSPASGSKDVSAVCVFPSWSGMVDNVRCFMECVKSVYEVLKLGSWDSMPLGGHGQQDGILPYQVEVGLAPPEGTNGARASALGQSMQVLREAVCGVEATRPNVVVYFVYSPSTPATIVEACIAFQQLCDVYRRWLAGQGDSQGRKVVLQLVSLRTVSSSSSVVVASARELSKLCMETYDRCAPLGRPAMKLEQPLPRIIDFKLKATPSASLMRENSCMHVAYAQSMDKRWVTAAWTDDGGTRQETASYCLGRKGMALSRSMAEVATEIWETTLGLISECKVHWRIVLTKCSPMEQQEVEAWKELVRNTMHMSVAIVLLTVDSSPSLQLVPPTIKLPSATAALLSTPVSTPQASIMSPEPASGGAMASGTTPGAEGSIGAADAEADAVLVDVTEQTWGAVSGHRFSNPASTTEVKPGQMSGYLVKRTGPRAEDTPVLMEVNLVYADATPRSPETMLREMMSYFRGLGTLARARGVVARETDVRPWHVAVAEKGVRAVYLLM
ncbi:hypothetical protein CDD81_7085 [Ophiocordyceps australis]|uniref:Mediator of RNA polymerase II transcription subunit 13 n=1 Tax=Ophiocordyceps australis TaxID=1399860 RepID=A0A2C5Y5J8_9HYPO|nr:hypothetical protein CDD81_7085 [Ophiocordyceps australis]